MGVVYKARQSKLGRVVALKMILSGAHAGPDDLARFRTEAEAIARLQHPNIVQIYEVGDQNGMPYFSLEFCGGGSLEKELNATPLPPKKAAALVEALARAMHAAHEQGVIHRDLKPANVLRAKDGTPKVTDFGLAKKIGEKGQTATGSVMGTPSYMAPEQAGGRPQEVGPLADVWALGAILYECLTGRPPFKAATPLDTILQVVGDEPVPPRQLQSRTPRDLETICLKCLRKDPRKRYASALALASDLRRFQAGEPIRARPVGRVERAAKWVRRNPAGAALLATLLLGTAVSTLLAVRAGQKAAEAREQKGRADEQAEAAKANARVANDRAYTSDMRLVQRAWEENQVGLVNELLEGQRPEKTGGDDLRNFEWYYWWRTSHNELHTFQAHASVAGVGVVVNDLAFSPDGRRLASCGGFQPGDVKVWDTVTGQAVLTLPGHASTVGAVAFSPDGRRLVSGGERAREQGEVKVWDAATGKELLTLTGHAGLVRRVAFSPDGRRLASVSVDKTVKVWDTATGQEERTLQAHAIVDRMAFSPDSRRLATHGGTVKVWDLATGQEERTVAGSPLSLVVGVAFQPDGRCLTIGTVLGTDNTNQMKVWDTLTGQEVLTLKAPSTPALGANLSPDGRRLASGFDGAVRVWDRFTGQELLTLRGHAGGVSALAFSPDGQRLASGGTVQVPGKKATGEIKIWDLGTGPEGLTLRGHTNLVQGVAFSPDGRHLATTGDGTVKVWEVATGREALCLRGDKGLFGGEVAFSPDGRRLASCGKRLGQPGEVRAWDVVTGELLHTLRGHTGDVFGVAFSPDGSRLASRGGMPHRSGEVKVWDAATGQEIFTLPALTSFRHGVALSPDGRRLASSCAGGLVKVWDVATRQEVLSLLHPGDVDGVAFSPDGGRLASACWDRTVRVWDVDTGKEALTLRGHTQPVFGVAYSPDGRRLASCGGEPLKPGEVKVWDAASGQDILTLRGHSMEVDRVAFSPDGRRLASASNDQTVKVWDATELTSEARQARVARFEKPDPTWHLQEAEAAAGAGHEFALQLHVKYLASAEDEAPPFYTRRGRLYLRLGQGDKAVADFSRVIERAPRDAAAWSDRADALAGLGQWERAGADLRKAIELAPEDWRQWNRLASVSLAAGNADGYRTACETLLQTLDKTPNLLDAAIMARTLVLAPSAVADATQPLRVVEKSVAAFSKNHPYFGILGAALYRAGKYDAAVQRLGETIAAPGQRGQAGDLLFLAMAQHRLGRHDEARKSLDKALSSMDEKAVAGLGWESRVEWDVVRREAEALIRAKAP
jgi:WD40 repeat protein/tetratricopeptide (TPR) repeat protein/tRNA A-37 threonylcarbamoyl transferase component Bud32